MSSLSAFPAQILEMICDHCTTTSLLALSTTSHTLFKHAAPRIWRTLPEFAVLIYTLPQDSWKRREHKTLRDNVWNLTITRALTEADIVRFRVYAPFVQQVTHPPWTVKQRTHVVEHSTWMLLEDILEPGCLPNLRRITKKGAVLANPCEYIHLFIGPRLEDLKCYVSATWRQNDSASAEDEWIVKVLMSLSRYPTSIRKLEMLGIVTGDSVPALLSNTIAKMSQLERFISFRDIPLLPKALDHLASLSTLHILDIHVKSADYPRGVPSAYADPFPHLIDVTVSADTVAWIVAFAQNLRSPSLQMIGLQAPQHAPSATYSELFAVLADRPSNNNLRALLVQFDVPNPTCAPAALSTDIISPLFSLRSLETITVKGNCYAALDDHGLATMGDAWPHLQAAEFCSSYGGTASAAPALPPRATFAGVQTLTQKCPNLQILSIPLADVHADELAAVLEQKPFPRASDGAALSSWELSELAELGVGAATLEEADVLPMAAVLSQWFPSLEHVDYYPEYDPAEPLSVSPESDVIRGRWAEVASLVPSFGTVRLQERRRAVRTRRLWADEFAFELDSLPSSDSE